MRRIIVAVGIVVVLVLVAAGGWVGYRHFTRDPLAEARQFMAHGQLRAASLALRTLLKSDPNNAEAHERLGAIQLVAGDPVAAEKELRAAQATGYKGTGLQPLLARAILAQGRAKEVLATFSPDGLPPADAAGMLVARGMAQLALGNLAPARASADAAGRLAPKLADAKLLAARVAQRQGDLQGALIELDRALQLDPAMVEALLLRAQLLRATGKTAAALAALDMAVAANPNATLPQLTRAEALLADNQDDKARADIDAVLKREAKNPAGLYLKALLLVRAKDWAGADAALQSVAPFLDRLPRGEYYLALVKSNQNQPEQAMEAINRYLARARNDADATRLLARIDLQLGRKQDAVAALQRLLPAAPVAPAAPAAEDPASPQALTRLASLDLDAGNTGGAERELEHSLDNIPSVAGIEARKVLGALRQGDIDDAAAALQRLSETPKVDPEVLGILTSTVRLAQLDVDGARKALETALQAAPDSARLRLELARVLAMQGRNEAAGEQLALVLKKDPGNLGALASYADMQAATGHLDRAMAAVTAARAAHPENPLLAVAYATMQARSGDYDGAYATLDKIGTSGRGARVQAVRAHFLIAQGRVKEAAEIYRQMLQDAPKSLALRRQTVDLLLAAKEGDAALALARDGLKLNPGNSALQEMVVNVAFRVSGLDAALAEAAKLRADPANLPLARLLKGQAYLAAGRPADAAAAFGAEMGSEPFGALALAEAQALHAAGKPDAAAERLRAWIAKEPDAAASDMLASFDIEAHRLDAAQKDLETVLAARPNDPMALNNLAWVYQQKQDPRALALARKAYLLAPTGQTADTLGWILAGDGQAETALTLLRQAAARLPGDPSVAYHLAVALKDTGKPAQAATLLAAVLKTDVKFDEREQARRLQEELATAAAGK
ncbi:MAG: tetratricopeptide repeat protein [Alphaproteobacteria bacterium]|nr:tetratricopeptide repeat protein [Alphaproteobacteria bacterium]